jgi:ribosomal protein L16 Arg81 hydroxylase
MRFQDVIAPVTADEFIDRYLGRQMLAMPGRRGRFAALLSWDDLNAAINAIRISGNRLRLQQNGKLLDPDLYLAEPDNDFGSPIRGAEFERLLAAGATVVFAKVDELFPALRRTAESFEQIFRVKTRVNLYAGWRRQNGLDLHFDGHDTMILQVHGRKHWRVHEPTRVHPLKDLDDPPRPTERAVWDGVLEDGGLLYMPRGWWHVATPLDEPSLHLTVGLSHPTGRDLLDWMTGQSPAPEETRMDVPHLKSRDEQRRWITDLREKISDAWNDDVIDRFMAYWDTLAVARPDIHLPGTADRHIVLAPDTRLRLASGRRLHFAETDGHEVSFLAQDKRWTCAKRLVPALSQLNHLQGRSVDELCAAVPAAGPELMVFLSALALSGVVSVEPPER